MNPSEKLSSENVTSNVDSKNEQESTMEIQESVPLVTTTNEQAQQNVGGFSGGVSIKKLDANDEKMMWKLFKGKTVLMFRLCGSCQYKLFHSKDKWGKNKDGIDVKFHLCPRCVRVNCWATNLLAYSTPKKIVEKLENEVANE